MNKKSQVSASQRIIMLFDWAGEKDWTALANHLGFKRAQNLYYIRDGEQGISKRLASKIVEVYPDINLAWLLTGEGEMLKTNILTLNDQEIPYGKCPDCEEKDRTITVLTKQLEKTQRELEDCLESRGKSKQRSA